MINNFIFSCFLLAGYSAAAPSAKTDGYIHVPIKREISDGPSSLFVSLGGSSPPNISLIDNHVSYRSTCALGSPPQSQDLIVDTGSVEIWVYDTDVHDGYSSFNPSDSSTLEYVDDLFVVAYGDHNNFRGYHYKDDFSFSGVTITGQEFGYVNDTTAQNGTAIWGLAPFLTGSNPKYPTFNGNLKSQGYVQKEAFSMSLDDYEGQDGSIIFGALDKSKYVGDLWAQKITLPDRFSLNLTSLTTVNGTEIPLSTPEYGVLDSGTTTIILPDAILDEFVAGLEVIPFIGGVFLWYNKPTSGELTFSFGDATIKVPATALYDENVNILGIPVLLAIPASFYNLTGLTVLGDPFLRSSYVVYDYDDWEIAIAQASDGSGAQDIVVFENTPGIPGAKYS